MFGHSTLGLKLGKPMSNEKIQRQLRVSDIRLDFQPSENLIKETVQTYVDRLRCGEPLPPIYGPL